MIAVLTALLIGELLVLRRASRVLFGQIWRRTGSFWAAAILCAPGVVLHELSHLAMCMLLGVRTGEVRLFAPSRSGDRTTLGFVQHEQTDPWRMTLIAVAPVLFVPAFLLLAAVIALGTPDPREYLTATGEVAWWRTGAWVLVCGSASTAAFPSPGDKIGVTGALLLTLTTGAVAFLLVGHLTQTLETLVIMLSAPALVASVALLAIARR